MVNFAGFVESRVVPLDWIAQMFMNRYVTVERRPVIVWTLGAVALALAGSTFAEADQSASATTEQNQAAIAQTIEVMKAKNANQAAAKDRYDQMVESAKAEHQNALDKCDSQTDEPQKACKDRADAEFAAAKSKANHALEASQSAQP